MNERVVREDEVTPKWDDKGPWCCYGNCKAWNESKKCCDVTHATRMEGCVPQACQAVALLLREFMRKTQKSQAAALKEYLRQVGMERERKGLLILERCQWNPDSEGFWRTDCGCAFSFENDDGLRANDYAYCPKCGRPIKEN